MRRRSLVVLGAAFAAANAPAARTPASAAASSPAPLRLALMPQSGDERRVQEEWVRGYDLAGAGPVLETRTFAPEPFKATLLDRLSHGQEPLADVIYWFAGGRLDELASAGVLSPLDDLWRDEHLDDAFGPALRAAVSWAGRPWALPLNYYQWGFYYRRSTFRRLGLAVPATWAEFLSLADRARAAGLAPSASGAADPWTLAAWFDFLDLRVNGLAFHLALLAGQIPFDDPRVRRVLLAWQQARDHRVFLREALPMGWREAIPFLLHERAATVLMGNFFERMVPAAVRSDLGFFPFPRLDPGMPDYEDAPTDVLVVAARSRRQDGARAFLRWAARPGAQSDLARGSGKLPTRRVADFGGDALTRAGADLLHHCAGVAQFFDRDAAPLLAGHAMALFIDFVAHGLPVDETLRRLEAVRRATAGTLA